MSHADSHQARLRTRPDLLLIGDDPAGDGSAHGVITVKDPVSLEYFRLGERESFLLETLREPLTIDQLHARYRQRFPEEKTSPDELLAFCADLCDCSLLIAEGRPAADVARREPAEAEAPWWRGLASPLAIRLPGIDPTRLLDRLAWLGRVVYGWPFALLLVAATAAVGMLLLGEAETLAGELGRLLELTRPDYATAALLAVVLTKSWHELGHALACRRFGGECHEMGVLLLVFTPCLYCDVSDAWTFRSRWRRAVVALGGVYFEAMIAVAAAAVWLAVEPGFLRTLALYVAVIASASSLLVNLNPLVRFDGYYLLADAWGVANLHQQSRRALWGGLGRWVAGGGKLDEPFDAPRGWLAAYAAVSTVYTTALLAVILWAVHRGLSAVSLRPLGDLLVTLVLGGLAFALVRKAFSLLRGRPGKSRLAPLLRLATVATVAGGVVWLALGITVEQSLRSPCRVEGVASATIAVPAGGRLESHVRYGQRIARGEAIARVEDPARELRRLELLEQEARLATRLASLGTLSQSDPSLFSKIAETETQLSEARRQRRTHEAHSERLQLRAPLAGRVLRPPPAGEPSDPAESVGWTGAPLDRANAGCGVEAGDVLCVVADETLRAVVLLDQGDSGLVRLGDPVRVALDRDPGNWLTGRVEGIALAATEEPTDRPQRSIAESVESALRGSLDAGHGYRVRVALDTATAAGGAPTAQAGAVGQARIVTGSETVLDRCLRWLRQVVRFG